MSDDPKIIESPLSRHFTRGGITVKVCIYRLEDTLWSLEVVDQDHNSIVWSREFETDDAALQEFLSTVEAEGLDGVLRDPNRLN
jgi:hypothetical protein